MVQMITGVPPNKTTPSLQLFYKMATQTYTPKYKLPEKASKSLRDFLEKTLTVEVAKRPSAECLLRKDPFLTGIFVMFLKYTYALYVISRGQLLALETVAEVNLYFSECVVFI